MKKEKMNPNYSVFNNHVNKAGKRALKVLNENFPAWYIEIRKSEEEGIMSIFNSSPSPASAAYVALVTAFVNKY